MPMYEFECPECKKRTEKLVAMCDRDAVRLECETCGARLKRVPTVATLGPEPFRPGAIMADGSKPKGEWIK